MLQKTNTPLTLTSRRRRSHEIIGLDHTADAVGLSHSVSVANVTLELRVVGDFCSVIHKLALGRCVGRAESVEKGTHLDLAPLIETSSETHDEQRPQV